MMAHPGDEDRRRRLLLAALAFARLAPCARELRLLHRWLDTRPGVGAVVVGMHRQGFDLSLVQYDDRGWRATFYASGVEHSATSAVGTAFGPEPWAAVQWAAWDALVRRESA